MTTKTKEAEGFTLVKVMNSGVLRLHGAGCKHTEGLLAAEERREVELSRLSLEDGERTRRASSADAEDCAAAGLAYLEAERHLRAEVIADIEAERETEIERRIAAKRGTA